MNVQTLLCKIKQTVKTVGKSPYEKHTGKLVTLYRFFKGDMLFYINGSGVLPAPLTKQEESEALHKLKSADEKQAAFLRNRLVERNLRLVVYIAKRFENTGIGIEDLISIGTLGLMKAVETFNPDKNIKLATYASRCIENEILMYIRKNAHTKNDMSLEEPLNVDWDGNELLLSDVLGSEDDGVGKKLEDEEEKNMLKKAVSHLKKRDKTIIELRFGLLDESAREMTQKDVAEKLGISQSYISRLEKRIIASLRREILPFYR